MSAVESAKCDQPSLKPNKKLGIRHLEAILLFAGLGIGFAMRVNMSVAIVAMTDPNATAANVPTFPEWSIQIKDTILSSFFWGYVVTQIPAGLIAERFGGKRLLAASMAVNVVVTMLTPLAATFGWQAVCACRIIMGLTQASLYPATHGIQAKWVPISERCHLTTFIYTGGQLGIVVQLAVAGILADSRFGWPSVFYGTGIVGAVWTIAWLFMAADSPRQHRWISEEEVKYIESSFVESKNKTAAPWKAILTSLPFWALVIAHCGENWGYYTLLTEIPSYMKNVLGVDIKANGLLSSLPYISLFLIGQMISFLSDYLINSGKLSRTSIRKIANTIAFWGPAIFLIGLSYSPPGDLVTAVALLTFSVGLNGGHFTGFLINHIDLSPNFAATLMGITNMIANILSILAPLSVGFIIKDETQASDWRIVFYVAAAVYFLTNLFFITFGSAQLQPWNDVKENTNDSIEMDKSPCKKETSHVGN